MGSSKPGDWAGHDRVLIWWSSSHTLIDLARSIALPEKNNPQSWVTLSEEVFFQYNLVLGLIHASFTKTNLPDSSLAETPPDHHHPSQWVGSIVIF